MMIRVQASDGHRDTGRSVEARTRPKPEYSVVVPITSRRKDRRFACEACDVKWYVPAERSSDPDPDRCRSCGGALKVFVAPAG